MTYNKRVVELAKKLRGAYRHTLEDWDKLTEHDRKSWCAVALLAIDEVHAMPKIAPYPFNASYTERPRKRRRPKACRIDKHGKVVCG